MQGSSVVNYIAFSALNQTVLDCDASEVRKTDLHLIESIPLSSSIYYSNF